uniref:Putative secreted protein n=1 Tax=Ixodes ricinus TaxID=34613 RepID=A0A6B0UQ19_IXORI
MFQIAAIFFRAVLLANATSVFDPEVAGLAKASSSAIQSASIRFWLSASTFGTRAAYTVLVGLVFRAIIWGRPGSRSARRAGVFRGLWGGLLAWGGSLRTYPGRTRFPGCIRAGRGASWGCKRCSH